MSIRNKYLGLYTSELKLILISLKSSNLMGSKELYDLITEIEREISERVSY